MLSVEIMDRVLREERQRQEKEAPVLRLPLEPLHPLPEAEEAKPPEAENHGFVVIDFSQDDTASFRVVTW